MIIAGDIGGTKTHLALFDWKKDRVDPIRLESFHSADYTSLEDMLTEFLAPPAASDAHRRIGNREEEMLPRQSGAPGGKTAENRRGLFRHRRPRHSEPLSNDQPPVGGRWRNPGETVRHTESEVAQRSRSHGVWHSVAQTGRSRNSQRRNSTGAEPGACPDCSGNRTR